MAGLEGKCLDYFRSNVEDIIKIPIDFNCLCSNNLLKNLADRFSPLDLYNLNDPKDKIKSNLYKEKIASMPNIDHYSACVSCKDFFRTDLQEPCSYQIPKIDAQGNFIRTHTADADFTLNDWVASVFIFCDCNWELTFWWFWLTSNRMACSICNQDFAAININSCCQHPKPSTVSTNGLCRQCQQPLYPFAPFDMERGCRHISHKPNGIHQETEKIFSSIRHLIIATKENVLAAGRPCSHSFDAQISTLNKDFFKFRSPVTIEEKPGNPTVKKKAIHQREADSLRMKSLIESFESFIMDFQEDYTAS